MRTASSTRAAASSPLAYTAIENANLAIAGLRKYGNVENNAGMRYLLGEALVLRALYYHDLVKAWGDVPARFQPIGETGDVIKPKNDRDVIYRADHLRSGGGRELRLLAQRVRQNGTHHPCQQGVRLRTAGPRVPLGRRVFAASRRGADRYGQCRAEPSQQAHRKRAGVGRRRPLHEGARRLPRRSSPRRMPAWVWKARSRKSGAA